MTQRIRAALVLAVAAGLLGWTAEAVQAQPLGLGQPAPEPEHGVLAAPAGRYVFGQISDSSKDQFMLDTHTGRLWRMSESGTIGIYLKSVPFRSEAGEYAPLPEKIDEGGAKKPAQP